MLNIAIKAARAAGAIINRASLDIERLQVTAKSHNDFVTEVDQAAEQAIIDTILEAYPGHGILAEESGRSQGAKHSEYVWIIDPLDGTTNFLHALPHFAVSIGVQVRGRLEHGVIYAPCTQDLYVASRNEGATLNNKRIRVSKTKEMDDALIGTGFPIRNPETLDSYLPMMRRVAENTAGLRRAGAAALDLAYVAAGRLDGFFELNLKPWDIAAGIVLVQEAGGGVASLSAGDVLEHGNILAATPKMLTPLRDLLGRVGE